MLGISEVIQFTCAVDVSSSSIVLVVHLMMDFSCEFGSREGCGGLASAYLVEVDPPYPPLGFQQLPAQAYIACISTLQGGLNYAAVQFLYN